MALGQVVLLWLGLLLLVLGLWGLLENKRKR